MSYGLNGFCPCTNRLQCAKSFTQSQREKDLARCNLQGFCSERLRERSRDRVCYLTILFIPPHPKQHDIIFSVSHCRRIIDALSVSVCNRPLIVDLQCIIVLSVHNRSRSGAVGVFHVPLIACVRAGSSSSPTSHPS